MCWQCLGKATPQIALEDKRCYKIVRRRDSQEFISYFKSYIYELDKKCPQIDIQVNTYDSIFRNSIVTGYHSYNINLFFVKDRETGSLKILGAKSVLEYYSLREDICGLECIIPKGALFYENENGEIVSETIIPIKAFELCVE